MNKLITFDPYWKIFQYLERAAYLFLKPVVIKLVVTVNEPEKVAYGWKHALANMISAPRLASDPYWPMVELCRMP